MKKTIIALAVCLGTVGLTGCDVITEKLGINVTETQTVPAGDSVETAPAVAPDDTVVVKLEPVVLPAVDDPVVLPEGTVEDSAVDAEINIEPTVIATPIVEEALIEEIDVPVLVELSPKERCQSLTEMYGVKTAGFWSQRGWGETAHRYVAKATRVDGVGEQFFLGCDHAIAEDMITLDVSNMPVYEAPVEAQEAIVEGKIEAVADIAPVVVEQEPVVVEPVVIEPVPVAVEEIVEVQVVNEVVVEPVIEAAPIEPVTPVVEEPAVEVTVEAVIETPVAKPVVDAVEVEATPEVVEVVAPIATPEEVAIIDAPVEVVVDTVVEAPVAQ